jgi:hypothetical protein
LLLAVLRLLLARLLAIELRRLPPLLWLLELLTRLPGLL